MENNSGLYNLRGKKKATELSTYKGLHIHRREACTTISMVNKISFTLSSKAKDTLQDVGISLSKSRIKCRLQKSKHSGFRTLIRFKKRKELITKHPKMSDQF